MQEIVSNRIESRRLGETVDPTVVALRNKEGSAIDIRLVGGVIESLSLVGEGHRRGSKAVHQILYSDGELRQAKRSASHVMSPAGPSEGLGGQHGPGRWLDWHRFALNETPRGNPQVAFQAKREDDGETLLRHIELSKRSARFESAVVAPYDRQLRTSLGEHFYFRLAGDIKDVSIDGKPLDWFTDDPDAFAKLEEGEPLYVPNHSPLNVWTIQLPELPLLSMETALRGGEGFTPSELWIWRRQGSEGYLCIEPVMGVSHDGAGTLANNQLIVNPAQAARLQTRIGLVR